MEENKESLNDIINKFYKDSKTGLFMNDTFKSLLRAGHKVTFKQIDNVIKNLDEYHKAKTYKEQKHFIS